MRTTIDIPDDLFRRVKAGAAMKGLKLQDYVAAMIEQGLESHATQSDEMGQNRPIPETILAFAQPIKAITGTEIGEVLLEDLQSFSQNRTNA